MMSASPSAAYTRFQASMVMDFEKWHDGIGFDLSAIGEMNTGERASVFSQLQHTTKTWREIEALEALQAYWDEHSDVDAAHGKATPSTAIADAVGATDRDTRLAAAEALHRAGQMPDFDNLLAREICGLTTVADGSVRTLLLAESYPSEKVKQALLAASNSHTECALHCAALLCYLCGQADSAFDFSLRSLFLKFGLHESSLIRSAAFEELCAMTGLTLREPREFLS